MDNCGDRLYVGGFSTNLSSDQIRSLISQSSSPFEVSVEIVENGSRRHRGFAFVQCRNAAEAGVLLSKFSTLFTKVNFAKREPKPAENVMSNISNVFVRGISREMSDTELYQAFGGAAEGVVQCHVADGYGFVLFDTRGNAQKKIAEMDGAVLNGNAVSVTWARPDTMGRKRKRPTSDEESTTDLLLKRSPPMLTTPAQLFQPVLQPLLPLPTPFNFPLLFPQNVLFPTAQPDPLVHFLNSLV